MMTYHEVTDSTNIRKIGYNPDGPTLRVFFVSGGVYDYDGVPERVFQEFLNSPSKGRYFLAHVKGRYQTHKVTSAVEEG